MPDLHDTATAELEAAGQKAAIDEFARRQVQPATSDSLEGFFGRYPLVFVMLGVGFGMVMVFAFRRR